MKKSFLCRPGKGSSPEYTVKRDTHQPDQLSHLTKLNNSTFMRSQTIAVRQFSAGKHLLLGIVLCLATILAAAQERTISGTVTNAEDASPLPRVTVQVKGSNVGTTTNDQGAFTIRASDNQTLVVSAIVCA